MDLSSSSLGVYNPLCDWRWRGNVLYFVNVTLQSPEGKVEQEPESLVSAKFGES